VPDTVSVIDLAHGRTEVIGTVEAPASLIGPPASIAISPDERLAIVTASQKIGSDTPPALVSAGTVTVLDLSEPSAPRVVQTLQAGEGASGVAINPQGTLALVANGAADSVSVFRVDDSRLSPAGTVALESGGKPVMVRFTPDGGSAWVVEQNANRIVRLGVNGETVTATGDAVVTGKSPYSLTISRDGRMGYVTNLQGRLDATGPTVGTIAAVDLVENRVVQTIDAGSTPEHALLSPDGRFLQVTVVNGSTSPPDSPRYNDHGLIRIFSVDGGMLEPLTEAPSGKWCQGAVWSSDSRRVLLQCADQRQIEVYRFNGTTLTRDESATITLSARPGAIASTETR
jgi:DNA-binding beta-propeller fold protein YncE